MTLILAAALIADLSSTPGIVVYVQGQVKIVRAGGEDVAALGSEVRESDTLVTEEASQVRIRLYDRSLVRLGPASRAQMSSLRYDPTSEKKEVSMKLFVGRLWASVSKLVSADSRFEVQANSAVAGVRGTSLGVSAGADNQTEVTCFDGSVNVSLPGAGDRLIGGGSALLVTRDGFGDVKRLDTARLMALAVDAQGQEQRVDERGAADAAMARVGQQLEATAQNGADNMRERVDQVRVAEQRERARDERPVVGATLTPSEQRQRAVDTFREFNEAAKSTILKGRIEIRE